MNELVTIRRRKGEDWQNRIMRDFGVKTTIDRRQLLHNTNILFSAGVLSPRYQRAKVPVGHHHRYKPKFHAIKFKHKPLIFVFHSYEWLDDHHVRLTPQWNRSGRRSVIVNCVTAQLEYGNHYGLGPPSDPLGILMGGLPRVWDGVGEHFILGARFEDLEHFPQPKDDPMDFKDEYTSDFGDDV
jgi:hypothetical protein